MRAVIAVLATLLPSLASAQALVEPPTRPRPVNPEPAGAAPTASVRMPGPARSVVTSGADPTGRRDSTSAFSDSLGRPGQVDVPPGTYRLDGVPSVSLGAIPYFHPGSRITGAAAGAFGLMSGYPFWGWFPSGADPAAAFTVHLPGQMRQARIEKSATGPQAGNGSDSSYPAQWIIYNDNVAQTDPGLWYSVNSSNQWNWLIRGEAQPVRGTGVASGNSVWVKNTLQSGTAINGESEGVNTTVIAIADGANGYHNWWGEETNVRGSASGPNRLIVGKSIVVQNPYDNPPRDGGKGYRGTLGQSIITVPANVTFPTRPGDHYSTTYPLDAGLSIGGYSGPTDVPDGNDARATEGYRVALDVGGNVGPWSTTSTPLHPDGFWRSKIGSGAAIHQYTEDGLRIFDAHPSATRARSLVIDASAGPAEIRVPLTLAAAVVQAGRAPSFTFDDAEGAPDRHRTVLGSSRGQLVLRTQNDDASNRVDLLALNETRATLGVRPNVPSHTPASSSEDCKAGDQSWDATYLYVCVATNTWKRASLGSW